VERLKQLLRGRERVLNQEIREKRERPFAELNDLEHVGDEADEASAITLADLRVLEADRDEAELRDIGAALKRLDEGTYGYCGDCGDEIATKRLTAQPTATRCLACQSKHERLYWHRGGARL
jgi:RNA polymerase-binding protein DksA